MAITTSLIQNVTNPEQFIQVAHRELTVPSLVTLYLGMLLTLFVVGLLMIRHNPASRGKFFSIFGLTAVISGMILAALIALPNLVHDVLALFTA